MKNLQLVLSVFLVAGLLAACEPPKTPANELTFEQQKVIVDECVANGKIETNDYCKEVLSVFEREDFARKQAESIKRAQKYKHTPIPRLLK